MKTFTLIVITVTLLVVNVTRVTSLWCFSCAGCTQQSNGMLSFCPYGYNTCVEVSTTNFGQYL